MGNNTRYGIDYDDLMESISDPKEEQKEITLQDEKPMTEKLINSLPPTTALPPFVTFEDCKKGETAAKTGCTPASGGGGKKEGKAPDAEETGGKNNKGYTDEEIYADKWNPDVDKMDKKQLWGHIDGLEEAIAGLEMRVDDPDQWSGPDDPERDEWHRKAQAWKQEVWELEKKYRGMDE